MQLRTDIQIALVFLGALELNKYNGFVKSKLNELLILTYIFEALGLFQNLSKSNDFILHESDHPKLIAVCK
jgi:hypothetical protein